MTMGTRIKQARLHAGLSQNQLAEQLDVSRQAVSRWERDAAHPSTENLMRLSACLDVSAETLLPDRHENAASSKRRICTRLLLALLALVLAGTLYIYSRPVKWDAGACGGGFSTVVFDRYAVQLTDRFLENEPNLRSAKPIRGTHEASWSGKSIFLQFDVFCETTAGEAVVYRLHFTGKRVWIETYRWSGGSVEL